MLLIPGVGIGLNLFNNITISHATVKILLNKIIKKIIPKNSPVFRLLFKWYDYKYWFPKYWLPTRWPYNVLQAYANYKAGHVSFIQVGSNNGVTGDPINKYIVNNHWQGILVEPVPYLFEELKKNYKNFEQRLIFENAAIASKNGKLKFYRLQKSDLPGLPVWYDQLGSFNKETVLSHKNTIPFFEDLFMEDTVNAITFESLLHKHSIKKTDLVHIDAEGYDFEIIKLIPFNLLGVELIMFEQFHLSDADYKKAIQLLRKEGYILGIVDTDTIGIKKNTLQSMRAVKNK